MDNKLLLGLVLLLIGFILGYLASFSAWGAGPRLWMMRPYGSNNFSDDLRPSWRMGGMMGYPTTTPDGYPINY